MLLTAAAPATLAAMRLLVVTAALVVVSLGGLRSAAQALPDAPTIQCDRVVDDDGRITYVPISCADLPASSEWHIMPPPPVKPLTFWTFRGSWQDPPLRTNRQFLTSKSIWIATGADFTAMAVACYRRGTGEELHAELIDQLGVLGFAYVGDRFLTRAFAVGPLLYAAAHYAVAARK